MVRTLNSPERLRKTRRQRLESRPSQANHSRYAAASRPPEVSTTEIVARIGGEQAANGINLPLGDLMIGACALELGYAIGTSNARDFIRIPGLLLLPDQDPVTAFEKKLKIPLT